jgi:hypothetical protein
VYLEAMIKRRSQSSVLTMVAVIAWPLLSASVCIDEAARSGGALVRAARGTPNGHPAKRRDCLDCRT